MNQNDNGQIVLNDWTAVRVTVRNGGAMGMTERGGFENPTQLSWLRLKDVPSCSTKTCLSPHNKFSVNYLLRTFTIARYSRTLVGPHVQPSTRTPNSHL